MLFPQLANASTDFTLVDPRLQRSQPQQGRALPLNSSGTRSTPVTVPRAAATASSSPATTSATNSADIITASDFLTLLVTELKNQDPTSNQDPNAYINQLVGVNSLQQLISINQELTPATSSTAAKSNDSVSGFAAEDLQAGAATLSKTEALSNALALPSPIGDVGSPSQIDGFRKP